MYVGQTLLTGDAIAAALLNYAEALALAQLSATVEIPVRLEDGSLDKAMLLIGPASEMAAVHQLEGGTEIVDDALVAHFRAETALLTAPPTAVIDELPVGLHIPHDL